MKQPVANLFRQSGEQFFYTQTWLRAVEDHINFFRSHPDTISLPITAHQASRFSRNSMGLFNDLNIPLHYHWVTMRTNLFTKDEDITPQLTTILTPSQSTIEHIRKLITITYNRQQR